MQTFVRGFLTGLVALVPLLLWTGFADATNLPKFVLLVVAAVAIGATTVAARLRVGAPHTGVPPALLWGATAFVGASTLATVTSPARSVSLIGVYNHHAGLILYVALATLALAYVLTFQPDDVRRLAQVATWAVVLVSAYATLQLLGVDLIDWETGGFGGVSSTLGNSNVLATVVGVSILPAAYLALDGASSTRDRVLSGIALILGSVALIGAASLGGWLALSVGATFFGAERLTREGRRSTPEARRRVVVTGGVGFGLLAAAAILVARTADLPSLLGERAYLYLAGWRMFVANPLTGVGLDGYALAFPRFRPAAHAEALGSTIADAAHNVPLNMFAVGGLPLGLAYLALVGIVASMLLRAFIHAEGDRRALLGAFGGAWLAYQAASLVSFERPATAFLHWWLLAMVAVLARAEGEERRRAAQAGTAVVAVGVVALVGLAAPTILGPIRADIAFANASTAIQSGQVDLAREELAAATELAPFRPNYWIVRADVLQRLSLPDVAAEVAARGALAVPTDPVLPLFAGKLYESLGEESSAERWLEEAQRRDPQFGPAAQP